MLTLLTLLLADASVFAIGYLAYSHATRAELPLPSLLVVVVIGIGVIAYMLAAAQAASAARRGCAPLILHEAKRGRFPASADDMLRYLRNVH